MRTVIIIISFCSMIYAQHPDMDFPLHIGDRWQYSEGTGPYWENVAVCDTTMPKGLTYTKITGTLNGGYYRQENSRVYIYNKYFETDSLKYDFSLEIGDTLNLRISEGSTLLTIASECDRLNIFGQDRNYMVFFTNELETSYDKAEKVVDGIGFVQYWGELLFYGLSGAVINGVQYGEIVDIEIETEDLPEDFILKQNYPNPFNPSTIIRFNIKEAGKYSLKVYNTLGQMVKTLSESYYSAGDTQCKIRSGESYNGNLLLSFNRKQREHYKEDDEPKINKNCVKFSLSQLITNRY